MAQEDLTSRLADSRARTRRRRILRAVIALVILGGSVRAVARWLRDLEAVAAEDLACPREQLTVTSFTENQKVVTGCGRCAHYAYPLGAGVLGPTRVLEPETLKYTCNRRQ